MKLFIHASARMCNRNLSWANCAQRLEYSHLGRTGPYPQRFALQMLRIRAFSLSGTSEDPGERICFCYSVRWPWIVFLVSCYGSLVVSQDHLLLDHQINMYHNPLLLAHWMLPTIPCCWLCFSHHSSLLTHGLFPMILCSWLSCISHDPLQVVL